MHQRRERRNGGRVLGVVIESEDVRSRKALQALSALTRETFRSRGFDVSMWPRDVRELLKGVGTVSRIVRFDSFNEEHVFVIADCGEFDVLMGVSSRREVNVPGDSSGNLATNVFLEVLSLPDPTDPSRPMYGEVGTEDLSRLWRNDVGAAHVQAHSSEWDLVLWSRVDRLDYLEHGTSLMGLLKGNQSSTAATAIVASGSKHKATAHIDGQLKYALGQTHPLLRINPLTRRFDGYNESVVGALRRAVELLRSGASWDEAAEVVGGLIPALQAQQEPDHDFDDSRIRTRERRNKDRAARGQKELALRHHADGTANADYRPETICDLRDPGDRLRSLLVKGPTVPRKDSASIKRRIDVDLDGISPADAFLEFYTTGVYRRLVKDQELSNSRLARYKWVEFDLGMTADGNPVLSLEDAAFLRGLRSGGVGVGSWGNNPLTGVFEVDQPVPLFTAAGYLDPSKGRFRVRSGGSDSERGLRIWFEPIGAVAHSKECVALGWLPSSEIGPLVAKLLVDALERGGEAATFRLEHRLVRADPSVAAKQSLAELERRHQATAVRLTDPELSIRTLAALKQELAAIELALDDAEMALAEALETANEKVPRHRGEFEITNLVELAAIVGAGVPVPPHVAERAARLLRSFLPNARLILEPSSATVRVEACLALPGVGGTLNVPVIGRTPNRSTDRWVAGVAGRWWELRNVPHATLMQERGLATPPGEGTRWREPVAERLADHARSVGRPLRGMNVARLIVRCDDPVVLGRIRDAIDTGEADPALHEFLYEGPDEPKGRPWAAAAASLFES